MSLPFPILTPEEAAELIGNGSTVGFSGFTPAGAAKAVPAALAKRAQRLHAAGQPFKIGVLTGASTGGSLDGALEFSQVRPFSAGFGDVVARRGGAGGGASFAGGGCGRC